MELKPFLFLFIVIYYQLMARGRGGRGGRSHGHGHRSHFGGHRHHGHSRFGGHRFGGFRNRYHRHSGGYYGGGGGGQSNVYQQLEQLVDQIGNTVKPPMFFNGTLALSGRDQTIIQQLNQIDANASMQAYQQTPTMEQYYMFPALDEQTATMVEPTVEMQGWNPQVVTDGSTNQMYQPQLQPQQVADPYSQQFQQQPTSMMGNPVVMQPQVQPQPVSTVLTTLSVTAVGAKTASFNFGCFCLTLVLTMLFILPVFVTCCTWWKKLVAPMYEMVNNDFYHSLGRFLNNFHTIQTLHLTVCDNSFNAEKAQILAEQLQRSQVKNFHFINLAFQCNNNGNEADDFMTNMMPIKALGITSTINWGDMTF